MTELAPWLAEKEAGIAIKPVGSEDANLAPWLREAQPGIIEDTAKTLAPSVLRGSLAAITTPRTISDLTGQGVNWAVNKLAPDTKAAELANKFHEWDMGVGGAFPSYEQLKNETERDITGPLYEAKTGVGKGAQVFGEVLPSVMGGGALPALGRAAGAGIGSAGLGETVKALKENLIPSIPAWAEPIARGLGAIGGGAGARRIVTPLPATPAQAALVAAVKAKDPNFPMSAGQETGSPRFMGLEGRSPRMQALPAKQEDAFTRGTMKEMGVDGLATPENVAKGEDIGKAIGQITISGHISPPLFSQLNTDVTAAKRLFERAAGKHNSQTLQDVEQEIKLGASRNPNVRSMTGERYQFLRESLQSDIDAASTGSAKKALAKIRDSLDSAFGSSLGADEAARLKKLQKEYANYKVITDHANINPLTDTVRPEDVRGAVSSAWGKSAINENKGTLAPWARNVAKVATEFPKTEAPHGTSGLGVILGSLLGAGAGGLVDGAKGVLSEGLLGGITGGHAQDVIRTLKNGLGRAVSTGPAQAYFRNQGWLPNGSSPSDKETLARLLMAPPTKQLLPDHSK